MFLCFSRLCSEGIPLIVGGLGVGPVFASRVSSRRLSSFVVVSSSLVVSGRHIVTIPCLWEEFRKASFLEVSSVPQLRTVYGGSCKAFRFRKCQSLARNPSFQAPTCLVLSLWLSFGFALAMGEAAKPFPFESVKMRGNLPHILFLQSVEPIL